MEKKNGKKDKVVYCGNYFFVCYYNSCSDRWFEKCFYQKDYRISRLGILGNSRSFIKE